MGKTKIAYLISHGHTARGALQTGLLRMLTSLGEVHVICKSETAVDLKESITNQGAQLHAYEYHADLSDGQRDVVRAHVHQNIKKNPALWEKHLRRTRSKKASAKRKLLNRIYYLFGHVIRTLPFGRSTFTRWERNGYNKPEVARILSDLDIDCVISTRPVDDMEIRFLEAARRLKIHRVMYILSWDNITSKGFFPVTGNSYLTWGPIMNEELAEYYGVASNDVYSTGVTHFDIHWQVQKGIISMPGILEKMGLEASKPYLFFTMSASYFAPNEIDIIEFLADQVNKDVYGSDMQLIVRPHMTNLMSDRSDLSWLERLKAIVSERVVVDFPDQQNSLLTWYMAQDDMIRLSTLLNGAAICLNSGSTIAIEAIYLDKPVIITAFDTEKWPFWESARRLREYVHLKKLFDTRACRLVDDLTQLEASIHAYLKDANLDSDYRAKAIELECFKNDGRATERFVENLKLVKEKHNLGA